MAGKHNTVPMGEASHASSPAEFEQRRLCQGALCTLCLSVTKAQHPVLILAQLWLCAAFN